MKNLKTITGIVVILLGIGSLAAGKQIDVPRPPDVVCQISQLTSAKKYVKLLAQIKLNSDIQLPKGNAITAKLSDKNVLTATVNPVLWNGEKRYSIAVDMNGKPYMRITHIDLEAYFEMWIEGVRYPFHCFPDIVENPK